MSYRVEVSRRAQKAIKRLHPEPQRRCREAILKLGDDPRPPGSKRLVGKPEWRIRVGDYRVIYEIDDGVSIVDVIDVSHRGEAYRRL